MTHQERQDDMSFNGVFPLVATWRRRLPASSSSVRGRIRFQRRFAENLLRCANFTDDPGAVSNRMCDKPEGEDVEEEHRQSGCLLWRYCSASLRLWRTLTASRPERRGGEYSEIAGDRAGAFLRKKLSAPAFCASSAPRQLPVRRYSRSGEI